MENTFLIVICSIGDVERCISQEFCYHELRYLHKEFFVEAKKRGRLGWQHVKKQQNVKPLSGK